MKFSIIIPVWNTEKYLKRCLDSVLKQTYQNYEVIIVNDGSPDNSKMIIDEYAQMDKRFNSYYKENGGLSDARNYGITKATGDYLLFLDSDDFYSNNLLSKLKNTIIDEDIVKYNARYVDNNSKLIKIFKINSTESNNALSSIKNIVQDEQIDPVWLYAIKKDFYMANNFMFAKGKIHEDFGLTPYMLLKAKKIKTIDYIGYNYVKIENSITNDKNIEKEKKKFNDFFVQYKNLIEKIKLSNEDKEKKDVILIYIVDSAVRKYINLDKTLRKYFKKNIKSEKIYRNLPSNSFKRFIKKYSLKYSFKLYLFWTSLGR